MPIVLALKEYICYCSVYEERLDILRREGLNLVVVQLQFL